MQHQPSNRIPGNRLKLQGQIIYFRSKANEQDLNIARRPHAGKAHLLAQQTG